MTSPLPARCLVPLNRITGQLRHGRQEAAGSFACGPPGHIVGGRNGRCKPRRPKWDHRHLHRWVLVSRPTWADGCVERNCLPPPADASVGWLPAGRNQRKWRQELGRDPGGGVLNPLPDYWIARLHKQLMGTTVLGIASSAADIRVYAHCALGGGVTMAFLNIALKNSVNVTLPEALAAAPAREEFMLTAGAPIKGAKNPLQSKVVLLNGTPLQLVPPPGGGGANGGGPSLPVSAGRLVPQNGSPTIVAIPPSTYGFMRFAGALVAACQ